MAETRLGLKGLEGDTRSSAHTPDDTSVKTVLDIYGHLYEGLDRDAANAPTAPRDTLDVVAMWWRADSDAEGEG
jgi:hypothetical protein